MELTVLQLAKELGAELIGDGGIKITAVFPIDAAGGSDITFITDDKYLPGLLKSAAGAVICSKKLEGINISQLVVKDVNAGLIGTLKIFAPKLKPAAAGIDSTAKVAKTAKVSSSASIGAFVTIEDNVEIGDETVIASGCRIGQGTKIGKNCKIDGNVVICHNCVVGNNVVIQANTTIGSVGFGYSFIDGAPRLIPHNGIVVIEDFVELGANCCIDRAKFGETRIGAGTKFDNLVHIAHNVIVGKCCLFAGQVGIAGSAKIGDGVVMGGQVAVADHIEIGSGTMIAGKSAVVQNVKPNQKIAGIPAGDTKEMFRIILLQKRLPDMFEKLKELSEKVKKIEAAKNDTI